MNDVYVLKLAAAIFGGFVGLAYVFHLKKISVFRIFVDALATVVLIWAAMDNFFFVLKAGECAGVGFGIGFLNGYLLDFIKAIAPNLVKFSFRTWVAWAFRLELPENVFDEKKSEKTDVLDEKRDHEAVTWLDDGPKKGYEPPTRSEYRRSGKK